MRNMTAAAGFLLAAIVKIGDTPGRCPNRCCVRSAGVPDFSSHASLNKWPAHRLRHNTGQ